MKRAPPNATMRARSERDARGESTSTLPSARRTSQLDAPYDDFDAHPHARTSSTSGAIGSGKRRLATDKSILCTAPIELVGQATSAIAARIRSSSVAGWRRTIESARTSERAYVEGATSR